ncbi:MAG: anti-sigma factor antagonist [Eubacteriales bacterium]|nr:anti-sigma factor antagonist [Eubacteriales bacterium]
MDNYFKIEGTDLRICVPAELDHHHAEQIRRGTDRLIRSRNIRRIIFDFQKTGFMDSSGIGMLMGRYKDMYFMGGSVKAVHVNDRVRKILRLSGVSKILKIDEGSPTGSGDI